MNVFRQSKHVLLHPLDFFYDIQFAGKSKLISAAIIIVLTVAARVVSLMATGFSYQTREPYQISFIMQAVWIIVPWLTWSIANWGVSTIIDGEGKFIDVLTGSAFAFVPYVLCIVPIAIITNLLSLRESMIVTMLTWGVYVWVAFLVFAKVKVIHDFEPGKVVWITLLTIAGMFIMWFIGLLLFGLINQAFTFVIGLYKEITFRL
ncbi:YIP1 family protein [Paenibacillus thermotolerans]|uniref:YIP1 family protein n=1 Tax=Paenibacillus thermotolerans TaxID=3027807 RepID=UPI002367A610|nr:MULTISPECIES: YIP1 family protein [unclassified Paenibacillus]